jgi:hypothetical protein
MNSTRNTAGSYTITANTENGTRTWEVCKEYDSERGTHGGNFWYVYETTDSKREWYGWGWNTKSEAIKYIAQSI